jgi:protoporphyrinogen oxidase
MIRVNPRTKFEPMKKNKIAVIGAGISGLAIAQMLNKWADVQVFEKNNKPGGLISCKIVDGRLYHTVGGHLFNSKNQTVLDWFWQFFDKDNEFIRAERNAKILLNNKYIGYPIENHLYQLDENIVSDVIDELIDVRSSQDKWNNLEHFLKENFGQTLYNQYFRPYNEKIWQKQLHEIPLDWLEGKLPMPDKKTILLSNIFRKQEKDMVHAWFYYPRTGGSQFIADRLAEKLQINYDISIHSIELNREQCILNGNHDFDAVVFTGDVRSIPDLCNLVTREIRNNLTTLRSNSTSNMLCESDEAEMTWLYIPSAEIKAHRIIYTGKLSPSNNRGKKISCVVEFSGHFSPRNMRKEINKLPGNLSTIASNFQSASYVIQNSETKKTITNLKSVLEPQGLFLLGRFAEWEYYNMDKCIESAMVHHKKLKNYLARK